MSLVFPSSLCYTDIEKDIFYMGFHTHWVGVISHRFDLGWRRLAQTEFQINNNYCARSMHRNDLHEGMFWPGIMHE